MFSLGPVLSHRPISPNLGTTCTTCMNGQATEAWAGNNRLLRGAESVFYS